MAQSDINVSNLALSLMGSRVVLTALSDATTEGVACNAMVDDAKKSLIRIHPWNFATKRKVIQPFPNVAVSNVTFVSSELIEVTHTAVTFLAGQYVTLSGIEGATGANGTWEIPTGGVVNGTTVRLTAIGITTSDLLGTYTASTTDYIRRSPAFDFTYLYTLPTDCLKVIEINPQMPTDAWRIESGQILSQNDRLKLVYLYDVTDYTTMDPLFYQALAHFLAYNLCDRLSASDAKKSELHSYLHGENGRSGILAKARFADATEDSQQTFEATEWVLSRI